MIFFYMQHLCKTSMDVTKRWVNEAQEAVNTDNVMVQYHALGLLYHIRKHDKLAVNKLVQKFTRGQLKSPYAMCLLVSGYSMLCFFSHFQALAQRYSTLKFCGCLDFVKNGGNFFSRNS